MKIKGNLELEQKVPGEPDVEKNNDAPEIERTSEAVRLLVGVEGADLLTAKLINILQVLKEAKGAEDFATSTLNELIEHLAVRIGEKRLRLDWALNIVMNNAQVKYEQVQDQKSGQLEELITLSAGDGTHKIKFKKHHYTFVQID